MLALILIIIGMLLRFAPHAPNFTPVAAIALFSGAYLNKKQSLIVPLLLMIVSDLVIGLHDLVFFTWGGFILISVLGYLLNKEKRPVRTLTMSLVSSLLFYAVTNFGVWLMGWYPRTTQGLIDCYIMGLPFLRNFTVATLAYTAVFFGSYEIMARMLKDTRLTNALLKDF